MNYKIDNIPSKELAKGITGKYVHSENMTIGFVNIDKGSVLPDHSHFHEQTTQIISGKLEMTIDGKKQILEPGSITIIPSNAVHGAYALTDCVVTDIFHPVREDYK
ncbi:cupin domain-containing protein [Flaviramulus sp. BrNp1-15]|uniref:cupin domain-containing protein n=1 Tax=Flaviramulus sp. BrNp1-15 TaxID=2916754 RepID=UPI001EE891A6|nr:cupin domain-containing protein [Flaviramulus sp. BrNp1-15]ULC60463.1 cupin domain-containing protein [Flaviramulus sp. BrNp1-15]